MPEKKVVFKFPPELVDTPVASSLVSDFGLTINILRARIEPDQEGLLLLSLRGRDADIERAIRHVRSLGIHTETLEEEVRWYPERCTHCTACRSVCPTGALQVHPPDLTVTFAREKCIACGLCVPVCPYRAIEVAV